MVKTGVIVGVSSSVLVVLISIGVLIYYVVLSPQEESNVEVKDEPKYNLLQNRYAKKCLNIRQGELSTINECDENVLGQSISYSELNNTMSSKENPDRCLNSSNKSVACDINNESHKWEKIPYITGDGRYIMDQYKNKETGECLVVSSKKDGSETETTNCDVKKWAQQFVPVKKEDGKYVRIN